MILPRRTVLLFSGMVITVGIHYIYPDLFPNWFAAYWDDIFALPVLCTIILFIQRIMINRNFRFPVAHVLAIGIVLSVVFELILPAFSPHYTSDIADVAMYGLGGLIFLGLMNR